MPKLNEIALAGFIFSAPKRVDLEGNTNNSIAVTFELSIERKILNKIDVLTIKCFDQVAEHALENLKVGDYLLSEDVKLRTKNYQRVIECICPNCHNLHEKVLDSEKTEIIMTDFIFIKRVFPKSLLGINKGMFMGNICNDIDYRVMASGKGQSKYKIALDRGGYMKRLQTADYPFVASFGNEADLAKKTLNKGDLVLIEGSIQERKIEQNYSESCSECGTVYNITTPNTVVEIISTETQFLRYTKEEYGHEEELREKPLPVETEEEELDPEFLDILDSISKEEK